MTNTETTRKTAYLWGPVSSFTGPLAVWLIKKGWNIHIACKSSLNLLSLSPLDLKSKAQNNLSQSFGGRDLAKAFQDRYKIVNPQEISKDTEYSAVIFAGLPPNFDDSCAPRAPWSLAELNEVIKATNGAPLFVLSSLFGGVQADGVVPEELEFSRRKAQTNWEGTCQQYENRLLEEMTDKEAPWYLVRLPLITGSKENGPPLNFNGLYRLFRELQGDVSQQNHSGKPDIEVPLDYNPNSTLWFLPVDSAVYAFWRYLEDSNRPRILNLIPTNSALNREWIQHLADALGARSIHPKKDDKLVIPPILRKLLNDDIQVKNRNLFEVAGRYHIPPVPIDKEYFERIIHVARDNNWGEPKKDTAESIRYSDKLAQFYFEEFLPELLNTGGFMDKAVKAGKSVGFVVKEASNLGWVLKPTDGQNVLERFQPANDNPRICFKFSGETLVRLILRKLPFH
ncbi:MAG: hypothetical protein K2Z81_06950, partial [Cyanobacteria bacterium]|nr:hypothetical protein [Cyanobacteriota bacterium]